MVRYVIVESPDTGKLIETWVCVPARLRELCAVLSRRFEYETIRPLRQGTMPKDLTDIRSY